MAEEEFSITTYDPDLIVEIALDQASKDKLRMATIDLGTTDLGEGPFSSAQSRLLMVYLPSVKTQLTGTPKGYFSRDERDTVEARLQREGLIPLRKLSPDDDNLCARFEDGLVNVLYGPRSMAEHDTWRERHHGIGISIDFSTDKPPRDFTAALKRGAKLTEDVMRTFYGVKDISPHAKIVWRNPLTRR